MTEILIKRLSKNLSLPKYKTDGASGMDLAANIEDKIEIAPGKSAVIPTGLSVSIPKDFEIQIRPRSGLAAKNRISVLNTPGTIDADYRGEIKVILYNHGNNNFLINNKDRIAQMILTPVIKMNLEETDNLPETVRGKDGFGSTGKWVQAWTKISLKHIQGKLF